MRKDFGPKPYIYPLPVLIVASYDENKNPNAMTAAWGMVCDIDKLSLCLSQGHKTVKNILKNKTFTVSPADYNNMAPADYVGVVSGNKVKDKIKNAGWTVSESKNVYAPVINELPLTLECKMTSYDTESEILTAEIINVSADESILDKKGNLDLTKFKPLAYDTCNSAYYTLSQKVGEAFNLGSTLK